MNYLIKGASAIFCHDAAASDIRIQQGYIIEIGRQLAQLPGETCIQARDCVIYPGLVNTHHHIAQSILKGIPAGLNQPLGEWLASVPYRFWPHITPDIMYAAACLGFSELLRSGTTTCADHHYLYHATTSPELEAAVWQAADDVGIRLVLCRGGATRQGSHKGMRSNPVEPESIAQCLARLDLSRSRYHQSGGDAMRKLVVAPTSLVHSSSPADLRLLAEFARSHGLKMHSHLLEVSFDEVQAQQTYQMSAVDYAESCHWLGEDVWFAHLVQANERDIATLAGSRTGIAHCPTSNSRLGSGIAPVIRMAQAGMPVSIGVDGSASSESGSMIQELNLTWLLHRAQQGAEATSLETVLKWGTEDGARLLGLDKVGKLAVGYAADLVIYDLRAPRFSGCHSPLLAPILCGEPVDIRYTFVHGRPVVKNGAPQLDPHRLASQARKAIKALLSRSA